MKCRLRLLQMQRLAGVMVDILHYSFIIRYINSIFVGIQGRIISFYKTLRKRIADETTFKNEVILFIFNIYHCCITYVASNSLYNSLS